MKTLIAAALTVALATSSQAQNVRFGTTQLSAGMNLIKAEVAASDAERQQGLMYRDKMANNAGMVFVFDGPSTQCMWMKNTLLPLSVAFIDASGRILNIEDMKPQTLDSHCSKGPVVYALEMNLGWFKQKNIKPGSTIEGLPPVK
jgi:uncharacterized protein